MRTEDYMRRTVKQFIESFGRVYPNRSIQTYLELTEDCVIDLNDYLMYREEV